MHDHHSTRTILNLPYGTKVLRGKILTNGSSMEFDEQNLDEFAVVFIENVLQRKH